MPGEVAFILACLPPRLFSYLEQSGINIQSFPPYLRLQIPFTNRDSSFTRNRSKFKTFTLKMAGNVSIPPTASLEINSSSPLSINNILNGSHHDNLPAPCIRLNERQANLEERQIKLEEQQTKSEDRRAEQKKRLAEQEKRLAEQEKRLAAVELDLALSKLLFAIHSMKHVRRHRQTKSVTQHVLQRSTNVPRDSMVYKRNNSPA